MTKRIQHAKTYRKAIRFCAIVIAVLIFTQHLNAQGFRPGIIRSVTFTNTPQQDKTSLAAKRLYDEGRKLFDLGTSASILSAIRKFEKALVLWRKAGERYAEAITLNFIGKAYDLLGDSPKALEFYNASLPILRMQGDKTSEANTLNNIGLVLDAHGEKRKALEYYGQALAILSDVKDPGAEGITLVNIGLTYDNLGEKQKALSYYQRALVIVRSTSDRKSEPVILNNLGRVYDSLGDKEKALELFNQARPILREQGNKRVEAITLNNIGYVFDSLDQKDKALLYYQEALPVLRAAGDRFKEAVTINNIGLVYRSQGKQTQALDYFTQALKLRQTIGDRPGEAETLGDLGMVYDLIGNTQKALASYNKSLELSRMVEDHRVEASTLYRIALVDERLGNLSEARNKMESALTIVETLRRQISSQELRASYFASLHKHFETYISLLMRMHRESPSNGYDALALKASERARARNMLDMLSEGRADIRQGVAPELLERENLLQIKLREASEKQTRYFAEGKSGERLIALKQQTANFLTEYQEVQAEIRSSSPRYAALTQPTPLGLSEIQKQTLDQNTLLLEYSLGDEKSFLWVVSPTSLKSYELPPHAEIEAAARIVIDHLTARNQQIKFETAEEKTARVASADKDFPVAAARLSQMLLGPVASELATKRLLIVGDGILDYIPFAALPTVNSHPAGEYRPMIVDHEIVALPSASTLALLRREMKGREPASKSLAVIADPVFDRDDSRITRKTGVKSSRTRGAEKAHLSRSSTIARSAFARSKAMAQDTLRIERLPFTRLEADQILSLVPKSESKRAVDFDANRDLALNPELGQYRYVHFATHGILNSQNPELSGLVLSLVDSEGRDRDGFLWAHEVFNLHLPVELVVLSGCRTGLGKQIKGEGIVGLTRGFIYAGAKRVVVSLWDISDEASAELMTQFYKAVLGKERLSPTAALRAAQLAVWKDKRWETPYYWAAFVIQGESN